MTDNPYSWQHERPQVVVEPPELDGLVAGLLRGAGAVLVGGRGMGKSVTVRQVEAALLARPGVVVARFPSPPVSGDVRGLLSQLARALNVALPADAHVADVLQEHDRVHGPARKVLLYDEADQLGYMAVPASAETLGGRWTRALEAARKDRGDLGVLVAGGPGLLGLGGATMGSPFLQRADVHFRQAFDLDALSTLCAPFDAAGRPWSQEALQTLSIATGGVPALATFVLEQVWDSSDPIEPGLVSLAASAFRLRHPDFLAHARRMLADPLLGGAPRRLLERIEATPGALSQATLRAEVPGDLVLAPERLLQVLAALGLARLVSSPDVDPIEVWATIHPLHTPAAGAPDEATLQGQLRSDLVPALLDLYRASADFRTRSGVVEEKVLSAVFAMALAGRGWQWEREVQEAAGRTDLRLHHPRFPGESALVEVKYWGRGDYASVHEQVLSYTREDTTAWATVTVHAASASAPAPDYEAVCLAGRPFSRRPSSLLGEWTAPATTPEGRGGVVEHLLVRLAQR